MGIGTNNTLTSTVSQEVELILAKMEGRAEAIKKGIPLTTVYETTMSGRLDDHVREVQAEEMLKKALEKLNDKEVTLRKLAERLKAWDDTKGQDSLEEKIRTVCSRRYLSPLTKEPFVDLLAETGVPSKSKDEVAKYLDTLENDIECCGIAVTKQVYEIFFTSENRPKWTDYLKSKYGLTQAQAIEVIRGIDILPAAKRNAKDTLLTLAGTNMTNTDFPNQQMNVLTKGHEPGFTLEDYKESVLKALDPITFRRLTKEWSSISELFIKSYELTPSQQKVLKEAKIANSGKYGNRGLLPTEWQNFGVTVKTMTEFSNSYEQFKKRCLAFVRKISKEK